MVYNCQKQDHCSLFRGIILKQLSTMTLQLWVQEHLVGPHRAALMQEYWFWTSFPPTIEFFNKKILITMLDTVYEICMHHPLLLPLHSSCLAKNIFLNVSFIQFYYPCTFLRDERKNTITDINKNSLSRAFNAHLATYLSLRLICPL